jgi:hypothetical protein
MRTFTKFLRQVAALATLVAFANTASAQLMANDLCDNAVTVTCGQTVTGNTNNSTIDTPPACGLNFPRYGVWYRFVGTGQTVTLSTCNATTNYDSQIGVFSGSCSALTCVAGNDNDAACAAGSRKSTVTFNSTAGTTYYIWVTGAVSARGNFSLSISCSGSVGVANDACASAISMNCNSTVTGSTTGATADAVGTCTTALGTAPGVWYTFTGNGGSVTASLCGSSYDTKIGVFSGSCGALTCVAGNDDFCSLQSQVTFQSTAGTTYYVLVTGFSTASGNFTLALTCGTPPAPGNNDACATPTALTCGQTVSGTTVGATTDGPAASCTGGSVAADRWYTIVGTGTTLTATMCTGTSYDSKLDIYTGACGALTSVACNDDFCGLQSQVSWASVSGTLYRVRVHGFAGATGAFSLTVTCAPTVTTTTGSNNLTTGNNTDLGVDYVGDFFPNPAQSGVSMLKINATQDGEASLTMIDALGRIVSERQIGVFAGNNQVEVDVTNLAAGTYFAIVRVNGQQFQKKLVVGR